MQRSLLIILLISASCSDRQQTSLEFDWQGHRGARGNYPENSIPGFLFAIDQGVKTLELDVVVTADLQVVASHEPFLNHEICLDPSGNEIPKDSAHDYNIFQMKYETLKRCDCGKLGHPGFSHQKAVKMSKPLLRDIIASADKHSRETKRPLPHYNIEIKSRPEWDYTFHPPIQEYVDLVIRIVDSMKVAQRVYIQSFDKRSLQHLHNTRPDIPIVLLEEDDHTPQYHLELLGFDPQVYGCYFTKVDKGLVDFCHSRNIKVIPWTVNDPKEIQHLIDLGVDGIITDYPGYISQFKVPRSLGRNALALSGSPKR